MAESTLVQDTYTTVIKHFIRTGRAPHYTELAETLGLQPDEARDVQREAAEAAVACWFVKDTDYIESWAPFQLSSLLMVNYMQWQKPLGSG